ncbi:MAG: helix-turn-helix domain-containing protein [Clostridia bacterium]|nr:helix-turn-helix domain-containing protein [Clostridia bacterium]
MKEINGLKLYDTREVADLFNITPISVTKMRAKGVIRSVRIGRRKYTSEESIRDYLNGLIEPKPRAPRPQAAPGESESGKQVR